MKLREDDCISGLVNLVARSPVSLTPVKERLAHASDCYPIEADVAGAGDRNDFGIVAA